LLLNTFSEYCLEWKLKINVNKPKALIFSQGRISNTLKFYINNKEIEIVKNYKYLGVIFARSGSFLATRKYLQEQAMKAMYSITKKCRFNNLSIECQLDMFDKAVVPILLYGSEVWGFENLDLLEKLHLRFSKHLLRLKCSTPNFMVYGELGRYPIFVKVKLRMISFWCCLLDGNGQKISSLLYKLLYINYVKYGFECKWLSFIKSIFDDCGMSNIWYSQSLYPKEWILLSVEQRLKDQFKQKWWTEINMSSKGLCYKYFKNELVFEKYLSVLSPKYIYVFSKYRCSSHRLPVETGRWYNISRNDRLCHLCDSNDIGDEFHYVMTCSFFDNERKYYLPYYCQKNANILKFNQLFSSHNIVILAKLCKFIKVITVKVSPPG